MLRTQLNSLKKENIYIVQYLQKIKTIADSLAAIGEKVSDEDLMMFVLNGLGNKYDVFVISPQNREKPYSFGEVKDILLSHEQFLAERHQNNTNVYDDQNTTFYARNGQSSYNINKRNGVNNKNGTGGPYDECQILCSESYQQPSTTSSGTHQEFTSLNVNVSAVNDDPSSSTVWIYDSGASAHMTGDRSILTNTSNFKGKEHVRIDYKCFLSVQLIASENQLADLFTKGLYAPIFSSLLQQPLGTTASASTST
ncbi:uncharacterized protein LOC113311371 [Papaver somniferum]|uniref:uncharacterized protein LOC113311371 n=1 Tax=Papaver somniferum TaxID=3469 RepID=UPI000E6F8F1B|nr:uncharacterized protein LOC113311371 [Papaver somniferum]